MPPEPRVLQSQRIEVLTLVRYLGLEPREFRWEHAASVHSSKLLDRVVHIPSGYFFEFDNLGGAQEHYATFSPGRTTHIETAYPGSWESQRAGGSATSSAGCRPLRSGNSSRRVSRYWRCRFQVPRTALSGSKSY